MRLQLFIWSTIVNAIFSFAMVALVLFSRPLTKVKIYWSAMCFAVGVWSLGFCWMSSTKDYSSALLACKILNAAALFITALLFHTVHALLKRTSRAPLYIIYMATFILLAVLASGRMLDVHPILDFAYYTTPRAGYPLFMMHLYGGFSFVLFLLWSSAQKTSPLLRKQLMLLFWGAGLGFLGGQMTIPPVYGVQIFPYGLFFVPVYIIAVGYGMLKYQFMDFRLAIRKLGLTLAIYLVLILIIAPIACPLMQSIKRNPVAVFNQILALSAVITILLAGGPIIYALVLRRTYWLRGHTTIALTHELKSPLANIRGAIEYLSILIPKLSGDTQSVQDYNDIVNRNTERLEILVENLLNMAAIQEGEITLECGEFSLTELIRSVAAHFLPLASQKGLNIIVIPAEETTMYGDRDKIEQVFSNLVSNAIKYSNDGSITIALSTHDNDLTCSVSDRGEGIGPDELDRVFDRFYQGKKAVKGTGIGLAIAKAWVLAHRGKIWAESPGANKGTTICFSLPRT